MFDEGYTTPEGHYLARPILLPEVTRFDEVLTYQREWDHRTMNEAGPDRVPYVDLRGNHVGPYCRTRGGKSRRHRSMAVVPTGLTIVTLWDRLVTDDDHISFELVFHENRDRCLVIADHSRIIGSHWLAYIPIDTIPEEA